jgi:hypothetical protein
MTVALAGLRCESWVAVYPPPPLVVIRAIELWGCKARLCNVLVQIKQCRRGKKKQSNDTLTACPARESDAGGKRALR